MPMKPLNPNIVHTTSKVDSLDKRKIHYDVDHYGCIEKENVGIERNIDLEIKEIENEISRLCSRLESLRLEKARNDAMTDALKTPARRGSSLGPLEITRGMCRRGLSVGPSDIYCGTTKMKLLGKEVVKTPVKLGTNRRKVVYWKLNEIDELRATKERGRRLSLSPKVWSNTVSFSKPSVTRDGCMKMRKNEDDLGSSIQPKKLFVKDNEVSANRMKSIKVDTKRHDYGVKEVKEMRKRSLPENEEDDSKRFEKKRVSLDGEVEEKVVMDHKTPLSMSKIFDKFPKVKTVRCVNESPRDSRTEKWVSELVGRKCYLMNDDVNDIQMDESF